MKKKLFILMVSVVTAFSMSAVVAFADDTAAADAADPAAAEAVVEEEAVEEEAEDKEEAAVLAGEETPAADEKTDAAADNADASKKDTTAADDAVAADNTTAADDAAADATTPADGTGATTPAEGTDATTPADGTDATTPADGTDATTPADGTDATTPAEGTDATTPADGTDATTPADGTDATTPADGTDAATPAEGTDATTPADGTDATTPADGTDPASQVDPNATANQKVFIEFIDNTADTRQTVRSHVDSRSATEKQVNYYVVGTTSSTYGNEAVYYSAYLTFAKWALKDTDGNTLMTSEDVDTWSWDLDITGLTAESTNNAVNWNIKKEFQKNELVEQSYRYLYNTNLFKNGMAGNTKATKGSTNMSANKVILNIDHNGTRYSVDMTDKDNPFYFLYHTGVCNAFGFVTSQQSKEIKIGTAPAPQTTQPTNEPECVKICAEQYCKGAKTVKQCDVPKTGDAQMSYEVLAALVLMLGGALVLTEKKRRAI